MARLHAETWKRMAYRLESAGVDLSRARILDIGCGVLYPLTILFHSIGAKVVGADIQQLRISTPDWNPLRNLMPWRWQRLRRQTKDWFRWAFYYRLLARHAGVPLCTNGLELRTTDAGALDFADGAFDVVVSFAAVEHFLDIPRAFDEIFRVLGPAGVAHLSIHLWTSLSGGHEKEFWNGGVPPHLESPWRHLRDPNWSTDIPLNRYRTRDYLAVAEKRFESVSQGVDTELGCELIDDAMRAALPEYGFDELVTEMLVLMLRKPADPSSEPTGRSR